MTDVNAILEEILDLSAAMVTNEVLDHKPCLRLAELVQRLDTLLLHGAAIPKRYGGPVALALPPVPTSIEEAAEGLGNCFTRHPAVWGVGHDGKEIIVYHVTDKRTRASVPELYMGFVVRIQFGKPPRPA